MRIEATINDLRAEQLQAVQEELGMSRSDLVAEALSFYLDALGEVRQGHQVAVMAADKKLAELRLPSFGLVGWVTTRERVLVSKEAFEAVAAAVENPGGPSESLKRRRKKFARQK